MSTNKKKIHYAWWLLLGLSIMVGLAKGGIMTAGGLFLTPVTEDLGIGMGSLTLYFSISSIVTMIFLPLAGKIIAKYDIRTVLVTAIILQAGSFAMFGLMNSVWGWYLFCIPMSIGSIFVTQIAGPVLINNWFKKHNGLAIGIMVASGGIFGAILQPMAGNLIASEGWRTTYFILGGIVIAIVVPIVLLTIRMSPKQKGLQPLGLEVEINKNEDPSSVKVESNTNTGISAAIAKKSSAFYALLLFFFFITAISSFGQHVAPFAMGLGYDVKFAGGAMGFWQVGVLIGALAFGILSDKIGAKNTAIFAMLLGLVPIAILLTVPDNSTMFSLAIGIYGFVVASLGTLGPLLTTAIFGNKEYGQIYASAVIGLAVAGIVALPGYGYVFQLTGSYTFVLYAIAFMLVINVVLIIMAFIGKKKLVQAGHWK
ncbi:MFS transporter [Viridibacillus sp. FSL R5-0477]|uniref:Major facilitator superfamily protein n=1 Tax=Viridibacillus arenosi FSL R5-213 TaxID=1227360 RepID=W4F2P8_9BACL|nr:MULTISPECIES: MFS transporter [Viridibacillus]ETT86764.1 major facilitator superfamily protein [Viridibacillus arenosi FSL R5-213]OMC83428.1 MFS transporter [Viridibacillus sp. FSL H8-0123]OMC84417.1 MFS transporter [Viridibacillus sp. FSL H7-0596]OMC89470.1 MFS transporter [Viridibacillus arenosi]